MRLWHYKLIPVLPKDMLVSQWRECIAIKRQWEKGTLKHRLVSYVMDYDKFCLRNYSNMVYEELRKRNIKCNEKLHQELNDFGDKRGWYIVLSDDIMYKEHNNRYLKQCLYNLEEKATRNIISKEEWLKIYNEFKDFTDLWDGE